MAGEDDKQVGVRGGTGRTGSTHAHWCVLLHTQFAFLSFLLLTAVGEDLSSRERTVYHEALDPRPHCIRPWDPGVSACSWKPQG